MMNNYRPQWKVMFSEASVSHSVHRGYLPREGGLHPGGFASGGVCLQKGLLQGGLHPVGLPTGGLHPVGLPTGGRPTRGGLHPGGWGLHPTGGVCTKGVCPTSIVISSGGCRGITRIHRSPSRPRPAVRPTAVLINIHEHRI